MPAPTRAELLALVQASGALDEIWAAAVLLYADPESYPELLELLEQLAQGSEWARMRSAIEGSGIASGINRRVHLGQTVAEIDRDAAHFAMLAAESLVAEHRYAEACAALGPEVRTPGDRVSAPWAAA